MRSEEAGDAVPPPACSTRITYGSTWLHPDGHVADFDVADGVVTWDGVCTDDGDRSFAVLSNGWRAYFAGRSACVIALDTTAACGAATPCTTRITYGDGWRAPAGHAANHEDVIGRVFTDGICHDGRVALSNGARAQFAGSACPLAFGYSQCGGLYANPVIPTDCPDPGVFREGDTYVLTCTSGAAADAFPIYTSTDLANWKLISHIFPAGGRPAWATGDFWAPEIHKVGKHYVAYFSARHADGKLAIGAAFADAATGPFRDLGAPLVHDPTMGLIDVSEISTRGADYLLWKEDGNAIGKPTPIHAQRLAEDGLSLTGAVETLITNDEPWEGAVTEGPFMVERGGMYYLFYSGNSYANATYAVGVARGPSPLGPMTKLGAPILTTAGAWAGAGHCSVFDTPRGGTAIVYHAWPADCVDRPGCGRAVLLDTIEWGDDGWPRVPVAPASTSRPLLR